MPADISLPTLLEEKLSQLITVRIGSNLPPAKSVDEDHERVARLLGRCPIGGLILFNGRWPTTRSVLDDLQSADGIPLLVGADIERGCGQQMRGMTVMPHAMAFAKAGEGDPATAEEVTFELGRATAVEARRAGINVAFAPVADTNTNPRNPIIATRSFGTRPDAVARLVASYVRGCESHGVATTAKHFPGHGDTHQDSHDSLPVVDRPRAELATTELPPFVAAIEAECSLVMSAHVAYAALDSSLMPATVSKPILTELLRRELGFTGIVCSDSLLMSGVRDRYQSEGELCLAALNAGVDLLLDVDHPERVIEFLAKKLRSGELDESSIDESVERIIGLKRRLFSDTYDSRNESGPDRAAGELAQRVAQAAVKPIGSSALPRLDASRPMTAILAKPFETPLDPPEQPLAAALRACFSDVTYVELGPGASDEAIQAARDAAGTSEQLLLAMIVKPAAWHKFGLLEYQQALFNQFATLPQAILVSLGTEQILDVFPATSHRLCTYSDVAVSQQAVVRLLTGGNRG